MINLLKLPLSAGLNLINQQTLTMNLILAPVVALGVFGGRKLILVIPQKAFEATVVVFAVIAGIRLSFF